MVFRVFVASMVVMIILSGSVHSFDGSREGFVLGGGLGIGPMTELKIADKYDKNEFGYAVNILIGYAWNNKNMLCLDYNATLFWPPAFGSDTAGSLFCSPVWYHYYGEENLSLYSAFGIGLYVVGVSHYGSARGWGLLLGGGYEFKKHFQVGIYYSGGNVISADYPYRHYYVDRLNAILTLVVY